MSSNLEIEAKVLVSKDEFFHLLKTLNLDFSFAIKQTNYYFDTTDFKLSQNNYALRIREKKGEYEVTLKSTALEGVLETSYSISPSEFKLLKDNAKLFNSSVIQILKKIDVFASELNYIGYLETFRLEMESDDSLLCFDENYFNGNVDYEIECESNSLLNAQNTLKKLLKKDIIEFNQISKTERTFERIKRRWNNE